MGLERILSVNLRLLEEDASQADEIFHELDKLRLDSSASSDAERMRQLFEITRAVMKVKEAEAAAAYDELEKIERGGESSRKVSAGGGSMGTRLAQEEIDMWKRRYEMTERELRDLESNRGRMKRDNEKMSERVNTLQDRVDTLERENKQYSTDIKDYQRQLQNQRESLLHQRDSEGVHTRDKEMKLKQYRDIMDELEGANSDLQQQVTDLQQKLALATHDINETTDQLERMKGVVHECEEDNVRLMNEKQLLIAKLHDVTEQQDQQTITDEQVLAVVEQKAQEWQAVLASKDEELEKCHQMLSEYQQVVSAAQLDQDRMVVMQLTKAVREKEQQVETLEKQLQLASEDINRLSEVIDIERRKTSEDGRVRQLQGNVQQLERALDEERKACSDEKRRREDAERDVSNRDRELTELSKRMDEYEKNHYGLSNAVQEIKEWKTKVSVRDRNISELTGHVNKLESQLNELHDENDALRQKLGIELDQSIDLTQYRYRRNVEVEQQKAVNRVLKKEVERLEEERQKMKTQLIKQAMHRGERAVQLGLTTDDLVAVEDLAGDVGVRVRGESEWKAEKRQLENEVSDLRMRLGEGEKQLESVHNKMASVQAQLRDAQENNRRMQAAYRDLSEMLKQRQADTETDGRAHVIQCPSLDSLLDRWQPADQTDGVMSEQWSAQIEQMSGRNAELRNQLVSCREEAARALREMERLHVELERVKGENEVLRAMGSSAAVLQPLRLPSQVPATHTEVVGSLNEQLIAALHALSVKEETAAVMEEELERVKRKFSVAVHQQGVLYREHNEKIEAANEKLKKLDSERAQLAELREQDSIKLNELQRLTDSLSSTPQEQDKKLREGTRKVTVLKLNEKALMRRLAAVQESEESLKNDNKKFKMEIVALETSVTERLGFLQRYKEAAQFQLSALQTTLSESVPQHEVEMANKQYVELMEKYRDLLQKESLMVERDREVEKMRLDVEQMSKECQELKNELQGEKERARTAEEALQHVLAKTDSDLSGKEEVTSYAQQLAVLEMKELNERQKAEHSVKQLELLKQHVTQLEQRNTQLEDKFSELARINLQCQSSELMLREELSHAVTRHQHESIAQSLRKAEETILTQNLEINQLKEVSEVAAHQNRALEALQQSQEKELLSLRNQLRDIQSQSDEKAVIGKLHRHIVQLQVSESTAVRKLEAAHNRVLKLEAALLRLDQRCVEKDEEVYNAKLMARNKVNRLQNTIQELRRRFSGALPIAEQEKFAITVRQLEESRVTAEREMTVARRERVSAEDKLLELEVRERDLTELIETLKSGQGAVRVSEWHSRMSEMRLDNLQLKRHVDRTEERVKQQEEMLCKREKMISDLQQQLSIAVKEREDRELQWERRESELEVTVEKFRQQQEEMANAAVEVERASDSLPDPTLPLANQLEHAVRKLKEHAKLMVRNKQELEEMRRNIRELEEQMKGRDSSLLQKDRMITELRMRVSGQVPSPFVTETEDETMKKALAAAEDTVSDLQSLVNQKDEALMKYQSLLERTRQEARRQADSHETEVLQLHKQLHAKSEDAFGKLRQAALDAANVPQPVLPTDKQLARLSELEELVAEQDNASAALSEKLRRSQQEKVSVQKEMERQLAATNQERATAEASLNDEIKLVLEEKEQLERKLQEQSDELVILRGELSAAQEAAQQAPSRTVRTLVEQLRNQLTLKEKQNKSLSQALLQLRADLVAAAQQSAESKARNALETVNVQQLIDAQTSELQGRIHELQMKVEKLRTELKQRKDKDVSLTSRIEDLMEQINRKEDAIERLTREVSQLQKVNNQLHSKEHSLMKEQIHQRQSRSVSPEIEDLRRQIRSLQSKLDQQERQPKQQKQTSLQPVMSSGLLSRAASVKSQEEVIRWEESKKWQKRVESLKNKLSDKTKECEATIKQVMSLRETITRLERERSVSHSRMKTDSDRVAKVLEKPSTRTEQLKAEVFQLKEQVASLQHQLKLGPQADMLHLQTTNQELVNTIHTLECQLKDMSTGSEFDALRHRQRELEDKVLMLEKDNVQLQLELESANATVPRLQSRVDDLQQYVSVLSSESNSSHQPSNGRDRVVELERVVAAMKRVVEKLQSENESLKRSRPSSKAVESSLAAENRRLKQELETVKTDSAVGSGNARPLASSKLITENDRLRRELKQEVERAEKFDVSRGKLELSNKQLQKQLQEVREEESSAEKGASSKMEKMRTLQAELDRKNGMLQEVKRHIRSAADREKEWQRKQAELEEQVSLLQRVSEGSLSLKQLSDQLASARQQVASYQEERLELLEEMARLKQQEKQQSRQTEAERVRALQIERDKLKDENRKLHEELKPFDPAFFDEIEDLKFNCKQAVERNVHYEEQLTLLSRQFGISVDIPHRNDEV